MESVRSVRRSGRQTQLVYLVPTFNNPSGRSLADDRRRQLVAGAAAEGLLIVEDDVYRELSYDAPPPPSLWSLGAPGIVIRLGSFAKSLSPGLRVGYMTTDPLTIQRFVGGGVLDSGGGYNHFAALLVAEFMKHDYSPNVDFLRVALRERRDDMLEAMAEHLPLGSRFERPAGGYFVWVTLPAGSDASMLLSRAESHGTSYVPGAAFYLDPTLGTKSLRLAFSRYSAHQLRTAIARLGRAVRPPPVPGPH